MRCECTMHVFLIWYYIGNGKWKIVLSSFANLRNLFASRRYVQIWTIQSKSYFEFLSLLTIISICCISATESQLLYMCSPLAQGFVKRQIVTKFSAWSFQPERKSIPFLEHCHPNYIHYWICWHNLGSPISKIGNEVNN